jgi:hypothetical protein
MFIEDIMVDLIGLPKKTWQIIIAYSVILSKSSALILKSWEEKNL